MIKEIKNKIEKLNVSYIAVILFLFSFMFPIIFYNYSDLRGGDLAEYINNPLRVINGDMPYKDFWLIFPPLEVYYPTLLYSIFGVNMFVLFTSSWIFGALCTVFSFLIINKVTKKKTIAVIGALLIFLSGMISNYSGFDYGGHIHLFFLLCATYLFMSMKKDIKYLYIGLLIGIGAGFRIDLSGAYYLAILSTIIYNKVKNRISYSELFKQFLLMSLGCSIIFLAIYLPLVGSVGLDKLLNEILINPPKHATAATVPFMKTVVDSAVNTIREFGQVSLISTGLNIFRTIYDLSYQLFPLIVLGMFVYFFRKIRYIAESLILFMFWALFTLPKALAVVDVHYLSVLNTILFFPFIIMLSSNWLSSSKTSRVIKTTLIIILAILLVSVPASRAIDLVSFSKQPTLYVQGEVDGFSLKDENKREEIQSVIDDIQNNTQLGDYIFVSAWSAPPLYQMTGRNNPSYYDSVIDLGFSPSTEKQEGICDSFREGDVKLIVTNNVCSFSWNGICFEDNFNIINSCIEQDYSLLSEYGQYSLYIR